MPFHSLVYRLLINGKADLEEQQQSHDLPIIEFEDLKIFGIQVARSNAKTQAYAGIASSIRAALASNNQIEEAVGDAVELNNKLLDINFIKASLKELWLPLYALVRQALLECLGLGPKLMYKKRIMIASLILSSGLQIFPFPLSKTSGQPLSSMPYPLSSYHCCIQKNKNRTSCCYRY